MQKITRELLLQRAADLLSDGTVDRVLGWKRGEFSYDVSPAVFASAETLKEDFVFDCFCAANLSKYLIRETQRDGRILVFLKPCDSYSFNQLLTEHRISREKVYIIGIPCDGMLDASALRALAPDGISRAERTVEPTGDMLTLHTL